MMYIAKKGFINKSLLFNCVFLVNKLSVPGEGDPEVPTNLGRRRGSAVNLHMLAGKVHII